MGTEDKHESLRAKILEESLSNAHQGSKSFGYFGVSGPTCIGDNSVAHRCRRKTVEEQEAESFKNIQAYKAPAGNHPSCFFEFAPPLAIGDPYIDPHKRLQKEKVKQVDPDAAFKPPGQVKKSINKLGYEYVEHKDTYRDAKAMHDKYKDYTPLRNIQANPPKKGGGGVFTPGVLFGMNEERKFPEHMPDDYDSGRKQRRAELEEHKAKQQEMAFKPSGVNLGNFQADIETYHNDQPAGVPREPKADNSKHAVHEAAFRPSNPSKKGAAGTCGYHCSDGTVRSFPEYIAEPAEIKTRKIKDESAEDKAAWKPGHPAKMSNPTGSIHKNTMNMRRENPRAFARPMI